MKDAIFRIEVTKYNGIVKKIKDISISMLIPTIDSFVQLPDTRHVRAVMEFSSEESSFEVELTEDQILALSLQSFKKPEPILYRTAPCTTCETVHHRSEPDR